VRHAKTSVRIVLTRQSGRVDDVTYCFSVEDADSGACVDVYMTGDQLAAAMTAMHTEAQAEWRRPDIIGKRMEHRRASVLLPASTPTFPREKLVDAARAAYTPEEGWEPEIYLGSQNSITNNGDGTITAHFNERRYVDKEPTNAAP
jgi:hypothetical protein